MTTKQPVFIEHLLCARNYPKNFCRLTGWFSQQLYMGGTVIIPVLQMRKQKQSWFKVFSIENIVLKSFSQVLGGLCPPKLLCWHSHSQYLKCDCFSREAFLFCLFFSILGLRHDAGGILVPLPGIELTNPAVEVQCPNYWTGREVLEKESLKRQWR